MAIKFGKEAKAEYSNAEAKGVGKGKAKGIANSKKPAGKPVAKSKVAIKKK